MPLNFSDFSKLVTNSQIYAAPILVLVFDNHYNYTRITFWKAPFPYQHRID